MQQLSTKLHYKKREMDFRFYQQVIEENFKASSKDSHYIAALVKFIAGDNLTSAEINTINLSPNILEQPYKNMLNWLTKKDTKTSQTVCEEPKDYLPSQSLAELHACKLFMRISYLNLIMQHMKNESLQELPSEEGRLNANTLGILVDKVKQANLPEIYRHLEETDSKINHMLIIMFALVTMGANQVSGYYENSAMQKKQMQLVSAFYELFKPDSASGFHDFQWIFLLSALVCVVTLISIKTLSPEARAESYASLNKIYNSFFPSPLTSSPLRDQVMTLENNYQILGRNNEFSLS